MQSYRMKGQNKQTIFVLYKQGREFEKTPMGWVYHTAVHIQAEIFRSSLNGQ